MKGFFGATAASLVVCWLFAATGAETSSALAAEEAQPKVVTNSIGMKLVLIPAGEFRMGGGESPGQLAAAFKAYGAPPVRSFEGEYPQHRVRITRPFYLGAHEVTVGQFRQFVQDAGCKTDAEKATEVKGAYGWNPGKERLHFNEKYSWRSVGFEQTDDHPVVNVSWNDAVAFCQWLSRKEGKVYRLPTEAEWEYACRAGTATRYWYGDDPEGLARTANVADGTARARFPSWTWTVFARDGYICTAPVGSFKANPFGLYDMHGNVYEWCADWYGEEYFATSPVGDPNGPPSGRHRVIRGGSWIDWPRDARSAYRVWNDPDYRCSLIGFRVARGRPVTKPPLDQQKSEPEATAHETPPSARQVITNSMGMKLVLIPAGEFMMGSRESPKQVVTAFKQYGNAEAAWFEDEHPPHRVRITKPFYLGVHEVTVGQFRRFTEDSGYKTDAEKGTGYQGAFGWNPDTENFGFNANYSWQNVGFGQTDDHPVVNVSWNDAVEFCKWLSGKEGQVYRLPTEAEWEYACRAGTATRYWHGDDPEGLTRVGNVADTTAKAEFPGWKDTIKAKDGYVCTAPVGKFKPNAWGLYDMHGNVWEWCADWYTEEYYTASPADDPTGPPSGALRVLRGGSWLNWTVSDRSASRGGRPPLNRGSDFGFRVARSP